MRTTRSAETDAADLPPEPPEVEVALKAVAQDLTRDFGDTGENLRDAMDLAPIAVVKAASALAQAATRPRVLAFGLAVIVAGAVILTLRLQRPPKPSP